MKCLILVLVFLLSPGLVYATPGAIVLWADKNDGHDKVWQKRPRDGNRLWGIRGSHKVEQGEIWFKSFPGPSGTYRVRVRAFVEADGMPYYALRVGGREVTSGRYPYRTGKRRCKLRGKAQWISLGEFKINQGERIAFWGKSVYECPRGNGAYSFWERLEFTPITKER